MRTFSIVVAVFALFYVYAAFACDKEKACRPDEEALLTINISDYKVVHVPASDTLFYIDYKEDVIKHGLSDGQEWEPHIRKQIEQHAKPGTTAVDIGSHIGVHSMNMARAVGAAGKVFAFEPQKKLYAEQFYNLQLNKLEAIVELRRQALGEAAKTVAMNPRKPENEGGLEVGSGGDEAEMKTLDSFALENVSLVKMDVEGYEAKVLLGAKETIAKNQPVIIFENWHWAADFRRVFEVLEALGYTYKRISKCDYLAFPKRTGFESKLV